MGDFILNEKKRRASALMMKYYSGLIDEGALRTASGDLAVFNTKYARNLKSLVVQLEPIQEGSGDPSPDNVRPISGRTGATVYQNNGKNYLNLKPFATRYPTLCSYDDTTGELTVSPNTILYSQGITANIPLPNYGFLSADFICASAGQNVRLRLNYEDGAEQATPANQAIEYTSTRELQNKRIVSVRLDWSSNGTFKIKNAIISSGSAAVPYTPYTGTTLPISWETEAGTVYGGELDVVSGVLTVDKVKHIVTLSDTVGLFQQGVNAGRIAVAVPGSKLSPNYETRIDLMCNISAPSPTIPLSSSLFEVGYCCMYSSGTDTYSKFIICIPSNIESANDARAWLIENSCEFVYKLATPQTYQLTPQQIQTLVGENVIWSDAGPVTVEYWS